MTQHTGSVCCNTISSRDYNVERPFNPIFHDETKAREWLEARNWANGRLCSIKIHCSKCSKKHSKTVALLKSHRQFACSCGTNIRVGPSKFLGPLKKVEQELANISRKITIKL